MNTLKTAIFRSGAALSWLCALGAGSENHNAMAFQLILTAIFLYTRTNRGDKCTF